MGTGRGTAARVYRPDSFAVERSVFGAVFSPLGIHIVKLTDTKPCISYEEARPYLMAYLDRLGAEHPALKRDVFARWTEGVLNDNGVQMRLETEEDALLASFGISSIGKHRLVRPHRKNWNVISSRIRISMPGNFHISKGR